MQTTEAASEHSLERAQSEYQRRLADRRTREGRFAVWERLITETRLVLFLLTFGVAWGIWGGQFFSPWWLGAPIALFGFAVFLHEKVTVRQSRLRRAVEFYDRGLARLAGDWSGKGVQGDRFLDTEHPYAADLDLFGRGSLFERICTARTKAGEETLASWLLNPADVDEVMVRQAAVRELHDRIDLREDLELLGGDVREGIEPTVLVDWGKHSRVFSGKGVSIAAGVLGIVAVSTLVGWMIGLVSVKWLMLAVVVELLFAKLQAKHVHTVLANLDRRTHDLVLLAELLGRLERETFHSPKLAKLRAELDHEGKPASRAIAKLARLLSVLDAEKNQFVVIFTALLLWRIQCAVAIDAWRARYGKDIERWLNAVGELEALASFAGYSWECPDDPFPTVEREGALFDAEGLGHPLLPAGVCIRNDLALNNEQRLLLVSGSNMSGKSTLLRSVGTNTVLALAGAPVRAKRLTLSLLSIGATLRIQDSLQAGKSRFYAEVTRLKQLVDLAKGPRPLLFLLDEILHGTNSHDRRIGAEGLLQGLLAHGAIGLVTTHDLALTDVVETLGGVATNVHFEDQFENGTLHFDYRMRPGVVRKSNALELMRAVGLEV